MPRCRGVGAGFRSGAVGVGLLVALTAVATAAAQTTHTVTLAGMAFTPGNITINVGDTVHWDWIIGFHNVESGVVVNGAGIHNGIFRSGDPTSDPNTSFELLFDQAFLDAHPVAENVYQYFCIVHAFMNMVGTVTVQALRAGDFNADGEVNLTDHSIQNKCLTGPGSGAPQGKCSAEQLQSADMNDDGKVDIKDIAAFQRAFGG